MASNIIGLDIGSYSIKTTYLKKVWRGFELIHFSEYPLPLEEKKSLQQSEKEEQKSEKSESSNGNSLLSNFVKEILSKHDFANSTVITSLPSNYVSFRIFTLPFTNKSKIEQVIKYTVESQVPFDVEDVIIDYAILSTERGESKIIASMVKKEILSSFLADLKSVGIEPKIIDSNPSALYTLSCNLHLHRKTLTPFAIIDIGHEKTSICIVNSSNLLALRTIPIAGKEITEGLMKDMNVTYEVAEVGKIEYGFIELKSGTTVSGKKALISQSIKKSISPLINEIQRTFHFCRLNNNIEISHIYLCGGTSNLRNLPEYIAEELNIETTLLRPLDGDYNNLEGLKRPEVIPVSFGLALKEITPGKYPNPNFRKEEFAYTTVQEEIKSKVPSFIAMAVIIILLFSGSILAKYSLLKKELDEVDNKAVQIFQSLSPETKFKKENFAQNMAILKTLEDTLNKKIKLLGVDNKNLSPLDILKEISSLIPKEIRVNIDELEINTINKKVTLEGETDTFSSIDKIEQELKKSKIFVEINSKPEKGVKEGSVKFKITVFLEKKEGA